MTPLRNYAQWQITATHAKFGTHRKHICLIQALSKNGLVNKWLCKKNNSRFLWERLWHADAQLLAMCLDKLAHGTPTKAVACRFPLKILMIVCRVLFFICKILAFVQKCWVLLNHVGLTKVVLHEWAEMFHRLSLQVIFQISIFTISQYKCTQSYKTFSSWLCLHFHPFLLFICYVELGC